MAQIVIDIPDDQVQRVLDAFTGTYGWQGQAVDGTKAAFAKKQVALWIKRVVRQYEVRKQELNLAAQVVDPGEVDAT